MELEPPVVSAQAVMGLRERLAECSQVASPSTRHEEGEPDTLAHAIADLADASRDYLRLVPTLMDPKLTGDQLVSALIDVQNVLAHMLYHIEDPRFFRDGLDSLRHEWRTARETGGK